MKRQMRAAARTHFVRGLSSLLEISYTPTRPAAVKRDPMSALKSDMNRVGADMYRVVEREKANEKATRKESAAAAE